MFSWTEQMGTTIVIEPTLINHGWLEHIPPYLLDKGRAYMTSSKYLLSYYIIIHEKYEHKYISQTMGASQMVVISKF